jgi:hypothetical protein
MSFMYSCELLLVIGFCHISIAVTGSYPSKQKLSGGKEDSRLDIEIPLDELAERIFRHCHTSE